MTTIGFVVLLIVLLLALLMLVVGHMAGTPNDPVTANWRGPPRPPDRRQDMRSVEWREILNSDAATTA